MDKAAERISCMSKSLAERPNRHNTPSLFLALGLGLGIIWATASDLAAGAAISARDRLHSATDRPAVAPVTAPGAPSSIIGQVLATHDVGPTFRVE